MSKNLRDYTKTLYTMDAVVHRVADDDWDNPSPNKEWTAKQTLGHVIWGMKRMTAAVTGDPAPGEQAEAEVAGERPAETWDGVREKLLHALDHHGVLHKEIETPFGAMTVDDALGRFLFDTVTHTWDIAQAAGIDAAIPDDLAEKSLKLLMALGDAIRGPGVFDEAIDIDENAPIQDKLIAYSGRQP